MFKLLQPVSYTHLYSDEPMRQLTKFIKENKAVNVVTGMAAQQNSPLPDLWRKFTSAHFFTVTEDGSFSEQESAQSSHIA